MKLKTNKEFESEKGITAQTNSRQRAKLEKDYLVKNGSLSPDLSKMKSIRIDSRTFIFKKINNECR